MTTLTDYEFITPTISKSFNDSQFDSLRKTSRGSFMDACGSSSTSDQEMRTSTDVGRPAFSDPKVPGSRPGRPTEVLTKNLRFSFSLSMTTKLTVNRFDVEGRTCTISLSFARF